MTTRELLRSIGLPERERRAYEDELTRLPNRRCLDRCLSFLAARSPSRPFCVFLIDLDGFKAVNDSLGHDVGDAVLRQVAQRLAAALPADAALGRWGGDEFVATVDAASRDQAAEIAQRLTTACRLEIDAGLSIGASVGVSWFPKDAADPAGLVRAADGAMYRVKRAGKGGWGEAAGRPRQARLNREVFVGREAELSRLRGAIADPAAVGGAAAVLGASGAGKTTLVRRALAAPPDVTTLTIECRRETADVPYAAFTAALRRMPPPPAVQQALPPPMRRVLTRIVPGCFGEAADGPAPDEKLLTLEAFVALIAEWSAGRPFVVFVDDAHWLDGETRDLLLYLHAFRGAPTVLVAVTIRLDETDGPTETMLADWARRGDAAMISLSPLPPAAVLELVRRGLGVERVPRELTADVDRQSGGNPFLALELLSEMVRLGHIVWRNGIEYRPFRLAGEPDIRLRLFLDHKLADLTEELRLTLRAAAVAAQPCAPAVLGALAGLDAPTAASALDEAQRRGFLATADDGESFAFANEIYRETVYRRTPAALRRSLHAAMTQLLVGANEPGLLAHHARNAGLAELASGAFLEASRAALAGGLCDAALSLAMEAAEALNEAPAARRTDERALAVHEATADAARALGDFVKSRGADLAAAAALEHLGRPKEALSRRRLAAAALRLLENHEESVRELQALLPQSRGDERGRVLLALADSLSRLGRCGEARARLHQASSLMRAAAGGERLLEHKRMLVSLMEGQPRRARVAAERALRLGPRPPEWWMAHDCAETAFHCGDLPRAQTLYRRGLALAKDRPSLWGEVYCLAGRALAELTLLRFARAESTHADLAELVRRSGNPAIRGLAACLAAQIRLAQRQFAAARQQLTEAEHRGRPETVLLRAWLELQEGRPQEGLEFVERAIALAGASLPSLHNSSGVLITTPDLRVLLAEARFKARGDRSDFPMLSGIAGASQYPGAAIRACRVLAEAAADSGDLARARRLCERALQRPDGKWQRLAQWELLRSMAERLPEGAPALSRFAARHRLGSASV